MESVWLGIFVYGSGWEFLCMVQEEEHSDMIRMYVQR